MKVVSAKPGAIAVSVHSADANLAGRYDLEVQAGWTLQDVRSRLQQRVQERSGADGKIQFMRWTLTKLFARPWDVPRLLDEQGKQSLEQMHLLGCVQDWHWLSVQVRVELDPLKVLASKGRVGDDCSICI